MITRPASRTHICLQCRIRMGKRRAPFIAQRSWQSTASRLKDRQDLEIEPSDTPHISHRPLQNHEARKGKAEDRLWGFSGHKLSEDSEHLNLDVLGKPADVVVLRESKISTYKARKHMQPVDGSEWVDIMKAIEKERGIPEIKEVVENINSLRPPTNKEPRTWDEFDNLVRVVERGFTVQQLVKYLEVSPRTPSVPDDSMASDWVSYLTPWVPGISKNTQYFNDNPSRGYMAESHTFKQNLALRILRECWMLELPELSEGIGQMEVQLRSHALELLLKGRNSVISAIKDRNLSDRTEKIEAFRKRKAIRITSTKSTSRHIAQQIIQSTGNICRLEFPLAGLEPPSRSHKRIRSVTAVQKFFDKPAFAELSRLTNTEISQTPDNNIIVSCIDTDPKRQTSNRADIARRLLMTSSNLFYLEKRNLESQSSEKSRFGTFVPYSDITGLPWRERLRKWMRWTSPIAKSSETEISVPEEVNETDNSSSSTAGLSSPSTSEPQSSSAADILTDGFVRSTGSLAPPTKKLSPKNKDWTNWSERHFTRTSMIIGNVLHSFPEGQASKLEDLEASHLKNEVIRTFHPHVPNVTQLLEKATLLSQHPTESILIRFLPNPWATGPDDRPVGTKAFVCFPPVELEFSYGSDDRELLLKSVRAIVNTEASDLMLPDHPVDLRFQRQTSTRLKKTLLNSPQATEDKLPGLASFIRNSKLDPQTASHLETPPSLVLPIAKHICNGNAHKLLREHSGERDYHVEYLYAGLEYRKTVAMLYRGWRLLYTSAEAGKAGGRRSELALRPIRHDQRPSAIEDFMQTAFTLADSFQTTSRRWAVRHVKSKTPEAQLPKDILRKVLYYPRDPRSHAMENWLESEENGDEMVLSDQLQEEAAAGTETKQASERAVQQAEEKSSDIDAVREQTEDSGMPEEGLGMEEEKEKEEEGSLSSPTK